MNKITLKYLTANPIKENILKILNIDMDTLRG